MNRLSPGARKLLALALLALPASLCWAALVAPWLAARDALAARIEQALSLEARALAMAARGPALTAEAAALRAALAGGAEGIPTKCSVMLEAITAAILGNWNLRHEL